ncbi:N-acetylglucosamine kinase-like BadF-type ATPase [Yoonia maricola]|uniref:N-acetylglucosamine kinase-like BadF-type ATPase n=1 Tax=Yoonia maricola TaxID=420999 RepID=A0A2M8WLS1_9RHOB|nr:BadF/BadG/BcrA/BcrD ATPase family protein [Yoonia maricola]PJI91869.1 N-acetylglucosamine kinase-like BadF-type ATPase [Yoonia maricola]
MMDQVVGIDAGGTKTLIIAVDAAANVQGVVRTKGFDPTQTSDARQQLRAILDDVPINDAVTLGLPYYQEIPEITASQDSIVQDLLGAQACIMNDVALAQFAAFAGGEGVLILAGTGSMAWAQGPLGTSRAGGFGDLFGDEGSAYWIGCRALAFASRQIDGRDADTGFAKSLCVQIDIALEELMAWAYTTENRRAHIAGIAGAVSQLARQNDATALAILRQAARELVAIGVAAAGAAGLSDTFVWSYAGGVLSDDTVLSFVSEGIGHPPKTPLLPPVGGAAFDAARRVGWQVDDAWVATLAKNLAAEDVS